MRTKKKLPLEGIRVVEFTTAWVGPGAGMVLCEMGAEVIKLENPKLPDFWRRFIPFADGIPGINRSGLFATLNRGKRDCLLDLKDPEAIEITKRLIRITDIVITNFAPRVMDNLGLGYSVLKEIKPDIIMVAASGYGATGPDKDCVAFGPVLETFAGLSTLVGYHDSSPKLCGMAITDHIGATVVALATLMALHYRNTTGIGQYLDISEMEALLACIPEAIMEYAMTNRVPRGRGNQDEIMAPHGCYRCQGEDKWISIAINNDDEWKNLCILMNRPELIEDERFQDGFLRWKNQKELDRLIAEWALKQNHLEVWHELQQANIVAAPVCNSEELYQDTHLRARNFFVEHEHPEAGKRELPGVIAKLSETPLNIKGYDPLFGEHTDWVLNELLRYDGIK